MDFGEASDMTKLNISNIGSKSDILKIFFRPAASWGGGWYR